MREMLRSLGAAAALLLLLLTLGVTACDDDAGAGTATAGACGGQTCAPGEVCVGGACRARPDEDPQDAGDDDNNPSANNPNNLNNNTPANNNPDLPDAAAPDAAEADAAEADADPAPTGAVVADPELVSFSVGMVGQAVSQRVLLLNNGERSVDILDVQITSASPGFGLGGVAALVNAPLERGGVAELEVTYTAQQLTPATAEIRVFTSLPSVVPITAQVQIKDATTSPCISVTPTRVGFGSVQRGQTETRQVQITNCGSRDLTVRELARGSFFGVPTPASFQWTPASPLPLVIPGQGRSLVEATFTPGRAGLEVGFFEVRSDDPASPSVRVDLNGVAEPPPIEEQDLHIQLEWDSNNCDVDLHFVREGDPIFGCPEDCFYANPNPDWGTAGDWMDDPFLDTDNIQGFGPENINVARLLPGTYRVFLHYYLDSYDGSSSTSTRATVRIYNRGQLLGTFGPQLLDSTGRIWDVARIEWPSAQVTPLGQLSTTSLRSCQ